MTPLLPNFPYPDIRAFRSANRSGMAELNADPEVAYKWVMGKTSPSEAKVDVRHYRMGPPVAILGIALYGIFYHPWLLATLPLFWLTLTFAQPPSALPPLLRRLAWPYYLTLGVVAGIAQIFDRTVMVAALAQAVALITHYWKYQTSVRAFKKAALANEWLFTTLWNEGAIQVVASDGKGYSKDETGPVDLGEYAPWLPISRTKQLSRTKRLQDLQGMAVSMLFFGLAILGVILRGCGRD